MEVCFIFADTAFLLGTGEEHTCPKSIIKLTSGHQFHDNFAMQIGLQEIF